MLELGGVFRNCTTQFPAQPDACVLQIHRPDATALFGLALATASARQPEQVCAEFRSRCCYRCAARPGDGSISRDRLGSLAGVRSPALHPADRLGAVFNSLVRYRLPRANTSDLRGCIFTLCGELLSRSQVNRPLSA